MVFQFILVRPLTKLVTTLLRPTVITAVPDFLKKVYDKIYAKVRVNWHQKILFFWAIDLRLRYEHGTKRFWYEMQLKIARKLIFSKWKKVWVVNLRAYGGGAALQTRLSKFCCCRNSK
jgi:long-chain acyl-CoA synthetase